MNKELVLEAGKTYVFKDDESKAGWLQNDTANPSIINYYEDGFLINEIDSFGDGRNESLKYCAVIVKEELKYFKLKEDTPAPTLSPYTFTKDMLKDGMVVMSRNQDNYFSKGRMLFLNGNLVSDCGVEYLSSYRDDLTNIHGSDFDIMYVYTVSEAFNLDIDQWSLQLLWERKEKSASQLKIEEIDDTIAELQKQLVKLKKGENNEG